jgi:hypothetical protein
MREAKTIRAGSGTQDRRGMSKNLPNELKSEPVLEVEAAVAVHLAQRRPHPCHSEAGFIGDNAALRNDNILEFFKLRKLRKHAATEMPALQ